jgi:hypothetical protein
MDQLCQELVFFPDTPGASTTCMRPAKHEGKHNIEDKDLLDDEKIIYDAKHGNCYVAKKEKHD